MKARIFSLFSIFLAFLFLSACSNPHQASYTQSPPVCNPDYYHCPDESEQEIATQIHQAVG